MYDAQEEIDASPLPSGAQPIQRIQRRDKLAMEVRQLEAQVDAINQSLYKALDKAAQSKDVLHTADVALLKFADALKESEALLKAKRESDEQRY
jgi:vacuolar-type H+-ATPase subunit D/Vma8